MDEIGLSVGEDIVFRTCRLPDYFEPIAPVAQHGRHVCIGGKCGTVAFVGLNGLAIPNLYLVVYLSARFSVLDDAACMDRALVFVTDFIEERWRIARS